ncbi:Site-specific recombinase XerD [Bosea sp. OK403]|nr:Site-specific recombinase XerD [Bosea sp. OK403]
MATIRKHRDKYQVRIRRKDASPLTRTFATHADAKEWANLQERLADRGELGPDRKALERTTLAMLVERYRDEVLPGKKATTIAVETAVLTAFVRHPICKKRLSDITTADFAVYRDQRLKEISSASLKRQLTPIRSAFRVAIKEWGIPLRSNPLSGLTLKAHDNRRERRLQEGELERLLEALSKARNPLLSPIIRLALATGLRRGELLALRERDIDLKRLFLLVREAKNGHSRTIPLTSEAVTAIKEALSRLDHGEIRPRNAVLFPIAAANLRELWNATAKRAELEDFHFHDLRHEAISRLFELGLTVPEVASVSGHRTMSMLMRYAHASGASVRAKMQVASNL